VLFAFFVDYADYIGIVFFAHCCGLRFFFSSLLFYIVFGD